MIFEEEFIINARHQEAWEFFTEFPSPIQVIPGLIFVKEEQPDCFVGAAEVRIGPFNFKFEGQLKVLAIDPRDFRVIIEGGAHDPVLGGHFRATVHTQTLPYGPNHSRITLQVHVGLGGIMGKFGNILLRPRARSIVAQYRLLCDREFSRRRFERASNLASALPSSASLTPAEPDKAASALELPK